MSTRGVLILSKYMILGTMVLFPSILDGLARSMSIKKGNNFHNDVGREAAETLAKEAKKNALMLRSSGKMKSEKSANLSSVCSKRGKKGMNQDCLIVWEEYGCQDDMIFCGIFDGHGRWGHLLSKRVRESLPASLLCNWQETTLSSLDMNFELERDQNLFRFDIWKQSFLKAYAAIDQELKHHPDIDSFLSGSTALTIVKQGEQLIVANVGDSRAVLATISEDDGCLVPLQLTIDFKPNLPQEAERIRRSRGQVFCLRDEPGVYRVWPPNGHSPGLAISRAFGDYCAKDFGLISIPEVSQRHLTSRDQFVILATDGVWDVISNQEAVQIISSTPDREKSARRLVECAALAWKRKKRGFAMDDISAICLFFHTSPSQQINNPPVSKFSAIRKSG